MYLADEPETSVSEVRPNVNDNVTVATYNVKKQLKTCTGDGNRVELTYAVKVKDEGLLSDVLKLKSVENAMLVAYTGDAQY